MPLQHSRGDWIRTCDLLNPIHESQFAFLQKSQSIHHLTSLLDAAARAHACLATGTAGAAVGLVTVDGAGDDGEG